MAQAVAFRNKLGLRSDAAWVREVASMADAIYEFEVPLTPEEFELLQDRSDSIDAVLKAVEEYGRLHREEWAGASQDVRSGTVIARFTANVAEHQAALWATLAPDAKLDVVEVRWSLVQLNELNKRIAKDLGAGSWLLDEGIAPLSLGVDEIINQVELAVSSTRNDLDPLLESHYEAAGMIAVTSDGRGVELLPKGDLAGVVLDAEGNPIGGLIIGLRSAVPGAGPGGDVAYGTNSIGRFLIPEIPAVTYTVLVFEDDDEEDGSRLVGRSEPVTVIGGAVTRVKITIQ